MLSSVENHAKERPKRKERNSKRSKSFSSKSKRSCGNDAAQKFKEMRNKENHCSCSEKNLLSLITRGRVTQKVGLYSKRKLSNTITRRKVLNIVQSSSNNEGVSRPLPVHDNGCSTPTDPSPPTPPVNDQSSTGQINQIHQVEPPPPSNISLCSSPEQVSIMETSGSSTPSKPEETDGNSLLLRDVARKIMTGLKPNEIFPSSNCVSDECTELRKILRQSDPAAFYELQQCFASDPVVSAPDCYIRALNYSKNTMGTTRTLIDCSCTVRNDIIDDIDQQLGDDVGPSLLRELEDSASPLVIVEDYTDQMDTSNIVCLSPVIKHTFWMPALAANDIAQQQQLTSATGASSQDHSYLYPLSPHSPISPRPPSPPHPPLEVLTSGDGTGSDFLDSMSSIDHDHDLDRPKMFPHRLY